MMWLKDALKKKKTWLLIIAVAAAFGAPPTVTAKAVAILSLASQTLEDHHDNQVEEAQKAEQAKAE